MTLYDLNVLIKLHVQDLLSGQFNVTLGDKLSEHLKKWIDVGNILQPQQPARPASVASTDRLTHTLTPTCLRTRRCLGRRAPNGR